MNRFLNIRTLLGLALGLSLLLAGPAVVQAALGDDLPDAETVIENFIKATGGRANYEKHTSLKMTGMFSMPAMGISAPLESYQLAPNKNYTIIRSDAFGTIESGSDGELQWEKTMMTGAKIKDGEEKAVADRQGAFNMFLRWKDFFASAETVAQVELDGRPAYKVVMYPFVGEPETSWYDVETHLLLKSSTVMNSDMGTISVESFPSNYQDVDGILVAFTAKQVLMGMQELLIETASLEWDVEIPEGMFDVPEDVKALMK